MALSWKELTSLPGKKYVKKGCNNPGGAAVKTHICMAGHHRSNKYRNEEAYFFIKIL
jgi:hypothetical protein